MFTLVSWCFHGTPVVKGRLTQRFLTFNFGNISVLWKIWNRNRILIFFSFSKVLFIYRCCRFLLIFELTFDSLDVNKLCVVAVYRFQPRSYLRKVGQTKCSYQLMYNNYKTVFLAIPWLIVSSPVENGKNKLIFCLFAQLLNLTVH